jgi:hypothetical protein
MSSHMMSKNFFSVGESAREIGRSTQYVRALIKTGAIEAERVNRIYIIRREEVKRVERDCPVVTREDYGQKKV